VTTSVVSSDRRPAALASLEFLRAYVTTMRPYLLFVSGITGIVGMSLVPGVQDAAAAVVGIAFFLSYGFGQALTDCFQLDTDAISAPYRPLVQARVRRTHVLIVSGFGLIAVGTVLVTANPWNLPLVLTMIAGLATYTWFKRRWWAGPAYNACIVAALCGTGVLAGIGLPGSGAAGFGGNAGGATGSVAFSSAPVVGTVAAVFFGYANFVLAGYFKDVEADRATGYLTLPVVAGRTIASIVSDGLALATIGASAVAVAAADSQTILGWIFLAAGAGELLLGQTRLHRVRTDRDAHRAIAPIVHAYVLLLSGVAACYRPDWAPMLIAFAGLYLITMRFRPERYQI
jgi:geranylgeranylglycerol-phosphate geranylgeranyltransferase